MRSNSTDDTLRRGAIWKMASLVLAGACFVGCARQSSLWDRHAYYSPFRESGVLTDWATVAIRKGIGKQVHPNVAPYPDNRVIHAGQTHSRAKVEKEEREVAQRTAQLVGGWGYINSSSDLVYNSVDEFVLALNQHKDHPQYADALAASMMLYPLLRVEYYNLSYGASQQIERGAPPVEDD